MEDRETLVVNLFAGAGAGKSSVMADVFARLKWAGIDIEMAPEFAKEVVWENRPHPFKNQVYIFGKQYYRITRLLGKVDVVITDSPILLSAIYDTETPGNKFEPFVLDLFNNLDTMNFFINREKKYNPNGRLQSETEAQLIDKQVKAFLIINKIAYDEVNGNTAGAHTIALRIAYELEKRGIIDASVFERI